MPLMVPEIKAKGKRKGVRESVLKRDEIFVAKWCNNDVKPGYFL